MDAVTYPDAAVQNFLNEHFVPVQFNVAEQPEVMAQFNTPWTPTLIIQDADGIEHRRAQGYHDAQRLLAEMALSRLKDAIDRRDFPTAQERAPEALERAKGDLQREPEAIYWSAVAAYKASDDPQNLLGGWNRLLDEFPDTEWAKRVAFIRM
jgi:uncharacterized protein YyaL (SSP411 family)